MNPDPIKKLLNIISSKFLLIIFIIDHIKLNNYREVTDFTRNLDKTRPVTCVLNEAILFDLAVGLYFYSIALCLFFAFKLNCFCIISLFFLKIGKLLIGQNL